MPMIDNSVLEKNKTGKLAMLHIIIIYKIMATGSYYILKVKSKEQNI